MSDKPVGLAQSLAGRDKGELFFVLEKDGKEALLADGKHRKLAHPKRKNLRHVRFLPESGYEAVSDLIGDRPLDAELRRAMAKYKATVNN